MRIQSTALILALGAASPASAQVDYRNLDHGRPVRVEDAHPLERYAVELLVPLGLTWDRGAAAVPEWGAELAAGLWPNGHLSIAAPFVEGSLAGLRLAALHSLRNESPSVPALGVRADLTLPVGALASDAAAAELTLLATRSWGRTRLHANAGYATESGDGWWLGVAADRTLFRQSLLLVGDLHADAAGASGALAWTASVGARWQQSPLTVVDFGVTRGLRGGPDLALALGVSRTFGIAAAAGRPRTAPGRHAQFYTPGAFNWRFLKAFPEAARLFNAFDYGHAVLYERLYRERDPARLAAALEREYRYLTTDLLRRPPRLAVAEDAIAPEYAKLAWRAKLMFEWAHVLHRQIYDVYADERIAPARRDSLIERLTDAYLRRADLAFAPVPKSMALMDEQPYSLTFARRFPTFNGLIWAYHWLQVGLYEAVLDPGPPAERRRRVQAAVAHFQGMVDDPARMPRVMPLTITIAPRFTEAHPRAAAIFDNLHMMHDIIADILTSDVVPLDAKGRAIAAAVAEFTDATSQVMTRDAWAMMGHHMGGAAAMGGAVPRP